MLADFVKSIPPEKEDIKAELKVEREKLANASMKIKEAKLPVMVIFEGWGSAGKGSVIADVIKNIDPRFFEVATTHAEPTVEEKRKPFLYRYFIEIPEAGKFKFFDTCWMQVSPTGFLTEHSPRKITHAAFRVSIRPNASSRITAIWS